MRWLLVAVAVASGCKASTPVDHVETGLAAFEAGDLATAAREYRLALDASPEAAGTHVALAQVLERLGDFAAAAEHCDSALELVPNDSDAWYQRGRLHERAGDDEAAANAYAAAVEHAPGALPPREFLAATFMRLGQYELAARQYAERLARGDGAQARLLYLYGRALIASGQCLAARDPLQRAYLAEQTSAATAEALIRVRSTCAAGDETDRAGTLSLATELFRARPEAAYAEALAMALAATGDFDNAAQLQARVLESDRATAYSHELLQGFRRSEAAPYPWPADEAAFRPPRLGDS